LEIFERYVKIMLNYTNMLLLEIFEKYFEGFVHYLKGILKTGKMLKLSKILSYYFWQKYVYIIKHVFHVSLQYFQWKYWFPHPVSCIPRMGSQGSAYAHTTRACRFGVRIRRIWGQSKKYQASNEKGYNYRYHSGYVPYIFRHNVTRLEVSCP
jgi:hypothetical protein